MLSDWRSGAEHTQLRNLGKAKDLEFSNSLRVLMEMLIEPSIRFGFGVQSMFCTHFRRNRLPESRLLGGTLNWSIAD